MIPYEQKFQLRKSLLKIRQKMTHDEVEAASKEIVAKCIELIPWEEIRKIHMYLPIASRNEVSTWRLIEYVWQNRPDKETYVPIIRYDQILSAKVGVRTRWQTDGVGIPRPVGEMLLNSSNDQFDVIIVPTLGFDRKGYRLGYGKGHYDRFIATQSQAMTIGVAYSLSEVKPQLPREGHDINLGYIITEQEIIKATYPVSSVSTDEYIGLGKMSR